MAAAAAALVRSSARAATGAPPARVLGAVRAYAVPPDALLDNTVRNAKQFEEAGPAPTQSIRRRLKDEATQMRRRYLLEVSAKEAERQEALKAKQAALQAEVEARRAQREKEKAARRALIEEQERLRLLAKQSLVEEKAARNEQRQELIRQRRAHVLAELELQEKALPTRENLDQRITEFLGRKLTYERGLFYGQQP